MVTLYPHQTKAVQWMRSIENRVRIVNDQPHGGILAHAMGLGKTISMLSMILAEPPARTLVVCPKSLLSQWGAEARLVGFSPDEVMVYHGPGRTLIGGSRPGARTVVVTTFEMVRMDDNRVLGDTVWDRVVLDEAHRICEAGSKTAVAVRGVKAHNRWCITGTPFKNGVDDLCALARFLRVAPYCDSSWWKTHQNNQLKMREWRDQFMNILDKAVLTDLPPMVMHNIPLRMSEAERGIYAQVSSTQWVSRGDDGTDGDQHELLRILRQRQASNHPILVAPTRVVDAVLAGKVGLAGVCAACAGGPVYTAACGHTLCGPCGGEPMCFACMVRDMTCGGWMHSTKTRALWEYLDKVARVRETDTKVVVFSQWTSFLDILGNLLHHKGVGYARYDGRVSSSDDRAEVISTTRDDPGCRVLLTSLGAGGEGVNMTFASHVVIMEPYWNMAAEQQAVDRLHRIGQTKETHVVRFDLDSDVETWVKEIQTRKLKDRHRLLVDRTPVAPMQCPPRKSRAKVPYFTCSTPPMGGGGVGLGAFFTK